MKKSQNPVVKLLVNRDGISVEEAIEAVESIAIEYFENAEDSLLEYDNLEEAILNELGLEPDFVLDVIAILDQEN